MYRNTIARVHHSLMHTECGDVRIMIQGMSQLLASYINHNPANIVRKPQLKVLSLLSFLLILRQIHIGY